ncbi:hypothetical protein C8J56DRAFT_911911, partial [Mycena floridula]
MVLDVGRIEKCLLAGEKITSNGSELVNRANAIVEGKFRDSLTSVSTRILFKSSNVDLEQSLDSMLEIPSVEQDPFAELLRLMTAVACLHAFIQVNWTGPDIDILPHELLSTSFSAEQLNDKAILELAHGGEPAYHLTQCAGFLRFSQLLLNHPFKHCRSAVWWRLRAHLVHQQVLDDPIAVSSDILSEYSTLEQTYSDSPELLGMVCVEIGRVYHYTSQDKLAAEYFVRAARATGLDYELTGALGKRTKFQITELSQLVLLAESRLTISDDKSESTVTAPTETSQPRTLLLNDDTLLEHTEFTSSSSNSNSHSRLSHLDPSAQPPLHPIDQCILLSLCLNVRNTSPAHGLTGEQMFPYIARVISHPRNWSVHTMSLLLRSRLESTRTRTVERSTLQLQALVEQMPTADSTISERLHYFHSIPLPSKWSMEKELAERFLSLGVVKSAMEIFERLEMFEEVVRCWVSLERPDKGLAIVRDLLEGKKLESQIVISRAKGSDPKRRHHLDTNREAKLWCLLGDLEPEKAVEHYEHAWSVSKQTSGRAMRSLGGYYFARAEYEKAVDCLKKAVAINPLLSRSWFVLGCAGVRLEDWETAKGAFARCVAIDEEDGESWNNLASVYLRMGQKNGHQDEEDDEAGSFYIDRNSAVIPFESKMLAFRALKQGLKYSYDSWRMWSNYMVVAIDVGELNEACRALGRVIDETNSKSNGKSQAVDIDVLERLVDAVTRAPSKLEDAVEGGDQENAVLNPNEGHGLLLSVTNLFERTILPQVSGSPRIFRAYAKLLKWQGRWEVAIKTYLDGYRCGIAGSMERGETDAERWRNAVVEVEEIVDILRNFGPKVEGMKWKLQARSILRTFMGRTKDFEDEPEWEKLNELQEEIRKEED